MALAMSQARDDFPPPLRAAMEATPVPPKSWRDGVAPAFVAMFLSAVFLDRLAPGTLLVGGLGPSAVGAVFAGLAGYWSLYYAPTMWGVQTRRPLAVLVTSTFGARGAPWIPGVVLGLVAVLLFAATIDAATRWTFGGLVASGMLDPKHLGTANRGSPAMPRPLFLFVAAVWSITSAILGLLTVRLVAAIMRVYPIFPAIALGAAVVWAMPTVGDGPVATAPAMAGGLRAMAAMAQLVFGFLAANFVAAGDWGAASKAPQDARIGGLVGITFASPILAILALLIVAGALGRGRELSSPAAFPPRTVIAASPQPTTSRSVTLREVFQDRIGGKAGATALFVMALGLLGPACFAPFVIARQFSAAWPSLPRWAWSTGGAVATWPLIASGLAQRTDLIFGIAGAAAAPVAGAMAAEYARNRGRWPGPRRGVNFVGMVTWAIGLGIGLVPYVGFPGVQPASMLAFVSAFVAYSGLAALGLESPPIAGEETPPP